MGFRISFLTARKQNWIKKRINVLGKKREHRT